MVYGQAPVGRVEMQPTFHPGPGEEYVGAYSGGGYPGGYAQGGLGQGGLVHGQGQLPAYMPPNEQREGFRGQ